MVSDELQAAANRVRCGHLSKAPALLPRSTCAQQISRTWGWPVPRNLPVVVVGDIDRGGLLAHLFGTVAVLEPADQRLVCGFLVNKFRGDPSLLAPGLTQLQELTGRPTYGVIPYTDGLWLDAEDSVSVLAHRVVGDPQTPRGREWLRVAAIRLPRISNSTDVEALACEPGVLVRWISEPADLADADVVVQIPGSKATVTDLDWLRERGLAAGIVAHARGWASRCSASAADSRCSAAAWRTPWNPEQDPSTVSGCSTPTSSSLPTRRCATTKSRLHGYEIHHGQARAGQTEDDWLGVSGHPPRRGLRHPLARSARQRRREAAVAHRRRRGRGPSRLRRRRRRSIRAANMRSCCGRTSRAGGSAGR